MSAEPLGPPPPGLTVVEKNLWNMLSVWPHLRDTDRPMALHLVKRQRHEIELSRLFRRATKAPDSAGGLKPAQILTALDRVAVQIERIIGNLGGQPMERVTEPPAGAPDEVKPETQQILERIGGVF